MRKARIRKTWDDIGDESMPSYTRNGQNTEIHRSVRRECKMGCKTAAVEVT